MITKFRVEGNDIDKAQLENQLQRAAMSLMKIAGEVGFEDGEWECVDEHIHGRPGNYRGRMVFAFQRGGMNNGAAVNLSP